MPSREELNTTEDGIKVYMCRYCDHPSGEGPLMCPKCGASGARLWRINPEWPPDREIYT